MKTILKNPGFSDRNFMTPTILGYLQLDKSKAFVELSKGDLRPLKDAMAYGVTVGYLVGKEMKRCFSASAVFFNYADAVSYASFLDELPLSELINAPSLWEEHNEGA